MEADQLQQKKKEAAGFLSFCKTNLYGSPDILKEKLIRNQSFHQQALRGRIGMDKYFVKEIGANRDELTEIAWGRAGDYYTYVLGRNKNRQMTITMSAGQNGHTLQKEFFQTLLYDQNYIQQVMLSGYRMVFVLRIGENEKNAAAIVRGELHRIGNFLWANKCYNCSEDSGVPSRTGVCNLNGHILLLNEQSFDAVSAQMATDNAKKEKPKDNLVGGIIGALVGSLVGVLAIVAFGQMNLVAALSGFVMGFAAFWGYRFLGGAATKRGILITVVICLIMTYVGARLDWAVAISRQIDGISVGLAFRGLPIFAREGIISAKSYHGDIALTYLFTIGGMVGPLAQAYNNLLKKEDVRMFGGKPAVNTIKSER